MSYHLEAPRCQHLKDDGIRCGSPALRGQPFCYHHYQIHYPRLLPGETGYQFPALESEKAIEITTRNVLQAFHDKKLDLNSARFLMYGIQVLAPYACRNREPYAPYVATELTPAMQASLGGVIDDPVSSVPVKESVRTLHLDVDSHIPPEHRQSVRDYAIKTYGTEHPKLSFHNGKLPESEGAPFKPSVGLGGVVESTTGTEGAPFKPSVGLGGVVDNHAPSSNADSSCPAGTTANSPALQRRVDSPQTSSAVGTTETPGLIPHTPEEIYAYWTQNLPLDVRELRGPGGDFVYTPPNWMPLTEPELAYLRDHLPPDGRRGTEQEAENLRLMTNHLSNMMVRPPTADQIRQAHRELWEPNPEAAQFVSKILAQAESAGVTFRNLPVSCRSARRERC